MTSEAAPSSFSETVTPNEDIGDANYSRARSLADNTHPNSVYGGTHRESPISPEPGFRTMEGDQHAFPEATELNNGVEHRVPRQLAPAPLLTANRKRTAAVSLV